MVPVLRRVIACVCFGLAAATPSANTSESVSVRELSQALWLDRFVNEAFPDAVRRAKRSPTTTAAVDALMNTPIDAMLPDEWRSAFEEAVHHPTNGGSENARPPSHPSFADILMREDMGSVRALAQETLFAAVGHAPRWYHAMAGNASAPVAAAGGGGAMLSFAASLGACCLAINWMLRHQIQRTLMHVLMGMGAGGVLFTVLIFVFASHDAVGGRGGKLRWWEFDDDDADAWDEPLDDDEHDRDLRRWKRSRAVPAPFSSDDVTCEGFAAPTALRRRRVL